MTKEDIESFGRSLGAQFAYCESDLLNDATDTEALNRVRIFSEIYRNFAMGGLAGFTASFERGYALARRDIEVDQGAELSSAPPDTSALTMG